MSAFYPAKFPNAKSSASWRKNKQFVKRSWANTIQNNIHPSSNKGQAFLDILIATAIFLILTHAIFTIVIATPIQAQMTVEDKESNILVEVTDEGKVGALVLPDTNTVPLITLNKFLIIFLSFKLLSLFYFFPLF